MLRFFVDDNVLFENQFLKRRPGMHDINDRLRLPFVV